MDLKEKLYQKALQLDICLNDLQLDQFESFYQMLIEKNKVMNLTSITEEDQVIDKHFIDSLSCSRVIKMDQIGKIIDIGTGAGFPGIPLKIAYPDLEFVLLDSLKKRIGFIDDVIKELKLDGIETLHGRAEDIARNKNYRNSFDLCVSRAVANLNTLCEYCIPFVKVNGFFVSYKSKKAHEEINNIEDCLKVLKSKIIDIDDFTLTDVESERVLIKIQKCKETPGKYPRKAGTPSRDPL